MPEAPATRLNRMSYVVVLLLTAVFSLATISVVATSAGAEDSFAAKRDRGPGGGDDDGGDDDGDSGPSDAATGTTQGTGASNTGTNDTATGTRTASN